jgi:hypothetical protein
MSRINLWSRSLSRVELDRRSRDARLRLEQLERLLISHAPVRRYRRWYLLPFGVGRYTRTQQERRVGRPLSDQRPSRVLLPASIRRECVGSVRSTGLYRIESLESAALVRSY